MMLNRGEAGIAHGQNMGGKPTPTMNSYRMMLRRCYDSKSDQFPFYGARGIKVCDSWRKEFMNFLFEMGERPDGTFLDRKENDGDYSLSNCHWTTHKNNCRNRRSTRWVIVKGEKHTFQEFGTEFCVGWHTNLYNRLRQGWDWQAILDKYLKPEYKKELLMKSGGYDVTLDKSEGIYKEPGGCKKGC